MAELEEDLYRRIAKQNGTTVEQEREKQRQREIATARANGQEVSSTAVASRPTPSAEGANPFVNGLVGIYLVGFLVGAILVGIGAANAGSYTAGEFSEHTDNGIAWIVWGGAFLDLGIVAALIHLGSAAVLWQFERTRRARP